MRTIATDGVAWFVGLSVMTVSPAKTVQQIVMLFGMWTLVGSRNHTLDRGRDPHT